MRKAIYTNEITKLATIEQAKDRYKLGRYALTRYAEEKGALVRFGRNIRINIEKMDECIDSQRTSD